ncbi:hypothetical protein HMPREF1548_04915 [Clostridium sp. KLE 1755]|nr:hypothetical protein HMPREF1548_04915 [Clostridium sp. KLE 1755]
MAVVKLLLPGFHGRKGSQYQDTGIPVENRLEFMGYSFHKLFPLLKKLQFSLHPPYSLQYCYWFTMKNIRIIINSFNSLLTKGIRNKFTRLQNLASDKFNETACKKQCTVIFFLPWIFSLLWNVRVSSANIVWKLI